MFVLIFNEPHIIFARAGEQSTNAGVQTLKAIWGSRVRSLDQIYIYIYIFRSIRKSYRSDRMVLKGGQGVAV